MTQLQAQVIGLPLKSLRRRLMALVVFCMATGLLVTAAGLRPDGNGTGTHQQLGLPACSMLVQTGYPCPTCGWTTSFTFASRGHLFDAFVTQPGGGLAALVAAMASLISGYVLMTGVSVGRFLMPLLSRWTLWVVLGIMLIAWLYKIVIVIGVGT